MEFAKEYPLKTTSMANIIKKNFVEKLIFFLINGGKDIQNL